MTIDLTALSGILKDLTPPNELLKMAIIDHPFLGMIEQKGGFTGEDLKVPVQYGMNQNVGSDFTKVAAQGAKSNQYKKFSVTRDEHFGRIEIAREALLAAVKDPGAFLDAYKADLDSVMEVFNDDLDLAIWGDGTGIRGTVSAVAAGPPVEVTLTNARDMINIFDGMRLDVRTGAVNSATVLVTSTDPDTAKFECTVLAGAVSAGDTLYRDGDYDDPGLVGIRGWCPLIRPAAGATFFGVDRHPSPALWGVSVDVSGVANMIDKITKGATKSKPRMSHKADTIFLHPDRWDELATEMGASIAREDQVKSRDGAIGYSALWLNTVHGRLPILQENRCPYNEARLLKMDSWKLHYLGDGIPSMISDDGLGKGTILRRYESKNSYFAEVGSLGQLVCKSPRSNAVLKLA